jgi:hypothetical protein
MAKQTHEGHTYDVQRVITKFAKHYGIGGTKESEIRDLFHKIYRHYAQKEGLQTYNRSQQEIDYLTYLGFGTVPDWVFAAYHDVFGEALT